MNDYKALLMKHKRILLILVFSWFLLDAQGQPLEALAHSMGDAGGATYHAKGGTYSLRISSNAHWTVTVVQLP